MGVRKTAAVGLLLAAGALTAPAAAAADQAYTAHGTLTYTWHGDLARGCAQMGVCGINGELVVRPDPSGVDLAPSGLRRAEFDLNDLNGTARVHRSDPGSEGDCIEPEAFASDQEPVVFVHWTPAGILTATLGGPLTTGRCAGPLPSEIAAVPLTGRRGGGRHPRYDLRETVPFVAGPYSGVLTSTVTFAPETSTPPDALSGTGSGSSSGSGGSGPPPATQLLEHVDLTYRVSLAAGRVSAVFGGATDPFCAVFDACGTHGSVTVSFPAAQTDLELQAERPVHGRRSRALALRDFRAGRLVLGPGGGGIVSRLDVTETLAHEGGSTCAEARSAAGAAGLAFGDPQGVSTGTAVPVGLYGGMDPTGDGALALIRSHCGGPLDADAFGSDVTLARGWISTADLLSGHAHVVLLARGGFSAAGYTGSRTGAAVLTLTLVHEGGGTMRVSVP